MQRIIIDQSRKLKRIYEITVNKLLAGHYCYVRARTRNINGWSLYCDAIDAQLPMHKELKFDTEKSSNSTGISFISDNKCVIFENNEQHNIAIIDTIIDKKEYNTFEWKYIVDFDVDEPNKESDEIPLIKQGICMGFIAYPLDKNMRSLNCILGSSGTQYGLRISNNSNSAHIYFTRNGSMHHTCSMTLNQTVSNGDIFRIHCNMKRQKCDIYHNDEILMDIFTSQQIPKKIIPAVSGYINKGRASATVQFVSST